ncbi:hypothetical protein PCASD_07437 [Puccinia coronata f. sp. avenae]|uniref:Uncharacterized protein n=1 Tax=Puccinia coronata f. sp. avenae TaxID=200324 RepID=A0A2N5TG46_9BASI|nr:hypothetical protein PCASD_07437 [Puccinia coronata f. sp. avenae]
MLGFTRSPSTVLRGSGALSQTHLGANIKAIIRTAQAVLNGPSNPQARACRSSMFDRNMQVAPQRFQAASDLSRFHAGGDLSTSSRVHALPAESTGLANSLLQNDYNERSRKRQEKKESKAT